MAEIEARQPEALWFGRERANCFGMLHHPGVASTRGVVFCNALGFEGLIAYRAFGHLADDLAARGFWALRFDYHGAGDSGGGPWEPDRVDASLESIDAAVTLMRQRDVTDISLVGFRMGASLAYRYATTHPGISSAVLWSPCTRGSAFVRELRALSRLSAVARPAQRITADRFPEDSMEVVGFEFAAETLRDLSDIDLVAAPAPVRIPSVLVIDRDDAPPNDDLVQKLTEAGSHVDCQQMFGYEDFVTEGEETSVLPWPVMRGIENWLDTGRPAVTALETPPAINGTGVLESATLTVDDPGADRFSPPGPTRDRVIEESVWLDGKFFAVTSRPAGDAPIRRASIVLCNTGSNYRVGPGRVYVTMARYWASLGFTVVRVDLGGSGDSVDVDPSTENQPLAPIRIEELRDVVTAVRRWSGFDRVVISGMCSGAFNAFHVAINGLDVNHLILINPGTFYRGQGESPGKTEEGALYSAHALTRGITNVRRWKLAIQDREARRRSLERLRYLFSGSAASGFRALAAASMRNTARSFGLPVRAPSALARDLNEIIDRGAKVLLVFAAGEAAARYLRTFGGPECKALLDDGDGLEIVDVDGGDHVFSPPGSRQLLVEVTTTYLEREYPPPLALITTDGERRSGDAPS